MTMSSQEARVIAEQLCTELAWRLDHGQAARAGELFTEDLLFGLAGAQVGRAVFEQQMAGRAALPFASRHCISNVRVTRFGEHVIEASSIALILKSERIDGEERISTVCGDWNIVARADAEGWRIASLAIVPLRPPE